MKSSLILASLALLAAGVCIPMHAKEGEPIKTTICELVNKPEQFSGHMVVVRADLINPRRMALVGGHCERVLLSFPNDDEVKPKARFKLVEDESFNKLMDSVSVLIPMPPKTPGRITGTFEGRFDSVFVLRNGRKIRRDPRSIRLAADEVRLVLRRVFDLEIQQSAPPKGSVP